MLRKKNNAPISRPCGATEIDARKPMPKYQAAEYLRLSYTDDKSSESDSIQNQKRLIADWLTGHPDIELVSTRVDDGYSGILFDRPDFQRMMDDIMAGRINCVIVKDLSRLGREYIETGRYLRHLFPSYGVRFIAINDDIDTANEHSGDDLIVGVKNLVNDTYCRDISVKTRTALMVKRKNGDYVGACPVYGYQKAPDNKNRLVIDNDAARVVRDIFRRRINGVSARKIADDLNEHGVLSPLAYKISRGLPHPTGGYADSADAKWSVHTIIRILQDETYTGTLVQGRQGTYNHKIKELIDKPSADWIRVENAHEPIIPKRDFDLVQKIMRLDTRTTPDGEGVYLFSGMLICGCCGARMSRKTNRRGNKEYVYYYCRTGKKNGCENGVMVREDDLTECVLASAQTHIKSVVSLGELLDSINEEQINRDVIEGYRTQIADNEAKLQKAMRMKATLYESFIDGDLSKDEYKDHKDYFTAQADEARKAVKLLREDMELAQHNTTDRLKWTQHFKEFASMTELDRRSVIALIESIEIIGKEDLRIKFRYGLEYEAALKLLAERKAAPFPLLALHPSLMAITKEAV